MSEPDPIRRNHVTVTGNDDAGRSLVFVHGFGTDQTAWRAVAQPFLHDFRVVLLDNVGAGSSDPAAFVQSNYLNLHRYVTDLLEVCAALDLRDATLIGHSVGGMICALATLKEPRRFSRLALVGASPRYTDADGYHGGFTEAGLDALYRAMTTSYSEWADGFAPMVMANPDQPELARYFAGSIKAIPPANALTVLCSIFQSDHRAEIAKLALPTLLIQAREDAAVPLVVAEYLHRHIRGSRLRVIDATGHLPHVSAPGEVVAALRDFVRATPEELAAASPS